MCKKKRFTMFRFLSFFLVLWFFVFSSISSYAMTTESGEYVGTIQEQWAQNIYDNYMGVIQNAWKFTAPENTLQELWNDYIDWAYDVWNLNDNDLQQQYHSFNRYVGSQWKVEKEPNTNQYTWHIDNSTQTYIDTWIQNYVGNNPLGYTVCTISSYRNINPDLFYNYTSYANIKEIMKQANGLCFLQAPNGWRNGYNGDWVGITCVDTTQYEVGFYGTCVGSLFSSVQLEHNWARTTLNPLPTGVTLKRMTTTGANATGTNYIPSMDLVYNTTGFSTGTGKGYVFTSSEKDIKVFVFSSLAALKRYNPNVPASYYLGEGYTGTCINPNGNGNYINNGGYQSIVGQMSNGLTADEIIAIINSVQNGNGNGGNGSGSGSSDNSGLWEKIGNAIGNLIDGIVDVIASVIEKLTDAILSVIHLLTGYTDEGGVYHEGLLGKLTSLISVDFNNFLGSVFDWLPPGIVTLFTATLVFAVFFAIWKMIRG